MPRDGALRREIDRDTAVRKREVTPRTHTTNRTV
jgi:hypothetical protein